MEHWALPDSEWSELATAIFQNYDEPAGTLNAAAAEATAEQLKKTLVTGCAANAPIHNAVGFTLRREPPLSAGEHFQTKPSLIAQLDAKFIPAAAAVSPTKQAKGESSSAAAAAKPAASSLKSVDSWDSTAKAGASGARAAATTTSAMMKKPSLAPRSGVAYGRPSGGRAAKEAEEKKNKRKMMVITTEEAGAKLVAATTKAEPAPKKPRKESSAGGVKKEAAKPDPFAGALADAPNGLVHYYQDRRKKWTYITNRTGGDLLRGMFTLATPLIRKVLEELPDGQEGEGKAIYAQKPNLGQNGVTWSQQDYGHRGLQAEYLRLKSIQRFTEGWCAMQRAYNAGAFNHLLGERAGAGSGADGKVTLRMASLGGGPGFELVAARAFIERHLPKVNDLQLVSLDLADEWQPCAEGLGIKFNKWDVNDGEGILKAAGMPSIDIAVISYVLYHYMSNEHCAEWLAKRLNAKDIKYVLIISRFEDLSYQIDSVQRRGVRVHKLMKQPQYSGKPRDDRQLLYMSDSLPALQPMNEALSLKTIFPNVPHEDGKDTRDKSYEDLQPPEGYMPPFIPSDTFDGAREGYAFKAGPEGTGYYKEDGSAAQDEPVVKKEEAEPMAVVEAPQSASAPPPPPPPAKAAAASSSSAASFASPWGYEAAPSGQTTSNDPPPAAAAATDDGLVIPSEVPEALHDSLRALSADPSRTAEVLAVLSFFKQKGSGQKEIVLSYDEASGKDIVLKLDYETWVWKRVKKKRAA